MIGLGLNLRSISVEALEILKKCDKVYLEGYTVDFPYKIEDLEKELKVKLIRLDREPVEKEEFLEEAKKKNVALLVYGDVLAATTHISIVMKCIKEEIVYEIFHNSSIFDAVAETGLQMYKFGKTSSIPKWQENYTPDSFGEIVKMNLKIKAHTLLLVDIGLELEKAKEELRVACGNHKVYMDKIVLCSRMGVKSKIFYGKLDELPGKIEKPFCFIIPSKLHEMEEEALKELSAEK